MRACLAFAVMVSLLFPACRSSDAPKVPPGELTRMPTPPSRDLPMQHNEVNTLQPWRGAAAAVVAGMRAARYQARDGGVLEVWDLAKKVVVATIPIPESELALTATGDTLVVVANDRVKNEARVLRLAAGTTTATSTKGKALVARPERVIATSSMLWVVERGAAHRYLLDSTLSPAGRVALSADQDQTCIGLGDGIAFAASGAVVRVNANDQRSEFKSSLTGILHLAPGPEPDQVWASTANAVHLLALTGGEAKQVREVAMPGVFHLAATTDAAAVLTVEMKAGAWSKLTLSVIGAAAVRWSKELPLPKGSRASVAGGPRQIAVVVDDNLLVFAATDGAAVLP
jgi:hypothetical protein